MLDSEALKLTSEQLSVSEETILEALKIESAYRKIHQSLKDKRKAERQKVIAKWHVEKTKEEMPDWCFCEEEGFAVKRLFEEDGILEHITMYSHSDFYKEHPYQDPIYRCSRCGKKYMELVAMA